MVVRAGQGEPSAPVTSMVREGWRRLAWYVNALTGQSAYEAYCAHQSAMHPDLPLPSEREFWRSRYAEQDAAPGARCC